MIGTPTFRNALLTLAARGLALAALALAESATAVTATYYQQTATPHYVVFGPNGYVYYTDSVTSKKVGFQSADGSSSGTFDPPTSGSTPKGACLGLDGDIWFGEAGTTSKLVRYNPRYFAYAFTEYDTPTPNAGPSQCTVGPDGAVWFIESYIDRVAKVSNGVVTEYGGFKSPAYLYDITLGPDGNVWVTEDGQGKLGKLTADGALTEYALADPTAQPYGIVTGPDGALWFTEYEGHKIGRITYDGGILEFALGAQDHPTGIALGPDGALWFALDQQIGRITTSGVLRKYDLEAWGIPQRLVAGRDGALWLTQGGLFTTGTLARIAVTGSSGDVNGDGTVDVSDIFYLIDYLFAGGPEPM